MNQDNYLGEAYKVRNLLELFRGDVRIVGFPEHIFSVSGGAVAHFSASNEVVFGSTVQRFLTFPLMVRFHYGHPDVWDKLWAISCGGVAKASRTLHVSEDIFGGFNVVPRGGTIDYGTPSLSTWARGAICRSSPSTVSRRKFPQELL